MTNEDHLLSEIRARLLEDMREYMGEGDVAYDESHIRDCDTILADHERATREAVDRQAALQQVRATVVRLNELNERCEGALIETDQREDICAFIIRAGYLRGFNGEAEDVTEEWRDW